MDLEDILSDDVSAQDCIDKILIHLDTIQHEDEEFMEILAKNFKDMPITWDQPWYQVCTTLSRPLRTKELGDNVETYKTDTLSQEESDRIAKNWRKLRKKYDIPDKLISLARWRNRGGRNPLVSPEEQARRFVVAYLAKGLQRTLHQVFKHIMTHFGAPVKGPYSAAEQKIMDIYLQYAPKNAVTSLSLVLSREPRGLYKRLEDMKKERPPKPRLKRSLHLATTFVQKLMEHSNLPFQELKYRRFDKLVWMKLEEDMDQYSINLQRFWYDSLHVQLFVKTDVKLNKVRRRVFKILKRSPYKIWTDIRWREVVKEFPDGFTHSFLYKMITRMVSDYPTYRRAPLEELIDHGLEKVKLKRNYNKRLKRLEFDPYGCLQIIKYEK